MKKKNIITIAVLAAVVVIIIVKLVYNKKTISHKAKVAIEQQTFDVVPVKTAIVKKLNLNNQLTQAGTFTPLLDLKLTAQSQGQIKELFKKKTQFAQKGEILATIDNSALLSQIETAKAQLEKAKQDAKRMKNALGSGGVTQQNVENTELQLKNAQTTLAQLQQQANNFQVVAPVTGIVNDLFVETGSFVTPGTPILELVDITKMILTVNINQELLPYIKFKQKVKITSDVYPNHSFEGTVESVNVLASASQKTEVGVSVQNTKEHPILGGMFGKAEFVTNETKVSSVALNIPRAAIIGSIQDAKVFVVKADSTVSLRKITVGKSNDNYIEVRSGLIEGEQIVTAGQINLEEGSKVIIKN